MQFGFGAPVSGALARPASLARICAEGEAIGYDYCTISDHVVIPRDIEAKYPYSDTGEFPGRSRGDRHEQLTAVAFVAGNPDPNNVMTPPGEMGYPGGAKLAAFSMPCGFRNTPVADCGASSAPK